MYGYPSAVVFKKKVYIGGGAATLPWQAQTVTVYDSGWDYYDDTLPPYIFKWFSIVIVNNQLILVGGRTEQSRTATNVLGVWNEQSKEWTHPLPPMTTACHSPSVATLNNRWLVVMGGSGNDSEYLSRVEILDTTDSRQWYLAASLPQPLTRAPPVTIGNMCYLLGGYTEGNTPSKKVFSVCLDDLISEAVSQPASARAPTPSPWQALSDTPLVQSTGLAFNGGLLAVGGRSTSVSNSPNVYHYQPSRRRWVEAGKLPEGQSGFTCTCTVLPSGDLFVAGGNRAEKRVGIVSIE